MSLYDVELFVRRKATGVWRWLVPKRDILSVVRGDRDFPPIGELLAGVAWALRPNYATFFFGAIAWLTGVEIFGWARGSAFGFYSYALMAAGFNNGVHHGEQLPPLRDRCYTCDATLSSYKVLMPGERQLCWDCRRRGQHAAS